MPGRTLQPWTRLVEWPARAINPELRPSRKVHSQLRNCVSDVDVDLDRGTDSSNNDNDCAAGATLADQAQCNPDRQALRSRRRR